MITYHIVDAMDDNFAESVSELPTIDFGSDDLTLATQQFLLSAFDANACDDFIILLRASSITKDFDHFYSFIDLIRKIDRTSKRDVDIDVFVEVGMRIGLFESVDGIRNWLEDNGYEKNKVLVACMSHYKNIPEITSFVPNSVVSKKATFWDYLGAFGQSSARGTFIAFFTKASSVEKILYEHEDIVKYVAFAMSMKFSGVLVEKGVIDCVVTVSDRMTRSASMKKQIDSTDTRNNVKSVMSESYSVRELTDEKIEEENDSKKAISRFFPKLNIDFSSGTFLDPDDTPRRDGSPNVRKLPELMSESKKYFKSTPETDRRVMVNAVLYMINRKRDMETRLDVGALDDVYGRMRSAMVTRQYFIETEKGKAVKAMFDSVIGVYSFPGMVESMIITNEPVNVLQKSTGVDWEGFSCEKWNGIHKEGIYDDVSKLNCVVFIVDKKTKKKYARMVIRWCDIPGGSCDVGIEEYWYYSTGRGKGTRSLASSNRTKVSPSLTSARATALLVSILESKGLYKYEACTTPYPYQGWSDTRNSTGVEIKYSNRKTSVIASGVPIRGSARAKMTESDVDEILSLPLDERVKIASLQTLSPRIANALAEQGKTYILERLIVNLAVSTRVLDKITGKGGFEYLVKRARNHATNISTSIDIWDEQPGEKAAENASKLNSLLERKNRYVDTSIVLARTVFNAVRGSDDVDVRKIAPKASLLAALMDEKDMEDGDLVRLLMGTLFWAFAARNALIKPVTEKIWAVLTRIEATNLANDACDPHSDKNFCFKTANSLSMRGIYIPVFYGSSTKGIPIGPGSLPLSTIDPVTTTRAGTLLITGVAGKVLRSFKVSAAGRKIVSTFEKYEKGGIKK